MVFEQTRELEGIRIVSRCPFVGRTTPRSIGERARAHRPPDPFRPSRRDAGGRQPGGRRFHPVAAAARAVAVSRAERAPSCTRATYSYHAWVSRAAGGDRGRPPCERIDRSRRPQVVPARGGGGGGYVPRPVCVGSSRARARSGRGHGAPVDMRARARVAGRARHTYLGLAIGHAHMRHNSPARFNSSRRRRRPASPRYLSFSSILSPTRFLISGLFIRAVIEIDASCIHPCIQTGPAGVHANGL